MSKLYSPNMGNRLIISQHNSPTLAYIASQGIPSDDKPSDAGNSFCVFLSQSMQTFSSIVVGLLADDPIVCHQFLRLEI